MMWSSEGDYSFIPTRDHSCNLGHQISIPRVLYHPLHLARADDEPGVNLLLVFHVVMPAEMIYRWGTGTRYTAVFPLFGRLRRYWGPGLRIEGTVILNGARRSRGARVVATLVGTQIRAVVRRPGVLHISSLRAEATVQWGPRFDCIFPAISLQWLGSSPPECEPRALVAGEPEECSMEELGEPLFRDRSMVASGIRQPPYPGYAPTTRMTTVRPGEPGESSEELLTIPRRSERIRPRHKHRRSRRG